MTTKIHDKLPLGNYLTSLLNSLGTPIGRHTGKAKEILTSSNFRRKIQTEDNQSLTSYQLSISTIVDCYDSPYFLLSCLLTTTRWTIMV